MLQNPVDRYGAPDFVQSGPLSHTFGQPFDVPRRPPIQRIRSIWPFSVAPEAQTDAGESRYGRDSGEDATPSSFVT